MVPRRYIEEWKEFAPWQDDAHVEQDLIIEKALLEVFSHPFLQERLAFRGGTALHKLFLKPQVRYSEDIDLIQITAEPIKDTFNALRRQLKFLGTPKVQQKANNNTIIYRFDSEVPPIVKLRLKIEINCREHFTVLGYKKIKHSIENTWTKGICYLTTFEAEEMLGTKLRALYQRKKGRDLFDLYYALKNLKLNTENIIKCYKKYIAFSVEKPPTRKQYLRNLEAKISDPDFHGETYGLLRPGIKYDKDEAYNLISNELIEKL